ncbi:MAG TPA: thermonuclease family protein [Rhizomicrobium sp.]|jgi:micrococcal nuclease|nr:thermonuclease family protein [Rhizomicrobium sp.]
MVALSLTAFAAALLAMAPMHLVEADFDGPVNARVVRVIDGDTFEASAAIWLGQSIDIHVRIAGIDAPELHARCDAERAKAEAARDFLARRIEGQQVKLSSVHYDKYGGRVDAVVADTRGDVAAAMLKARLARPYYGERRSGWCGQA